MLTSLKFILILKRLSLIFLLLSSISACSSKKQLIYLKDSNEWNKVKMDLSYIENKIEIGDILKIDVQSVVPEATIPYNSLVSANLNIQNIEILRLEGYLVDNFGDINFPILGKINTNNLSTPELEKKITNLLSEDNHLINHSVKVRRVNSKFTILGEVKNPGTFSYFDEKLTLFQALGYAGDLTVDGKRNDISLIREENGFRSVYKVELTQADLLNKSLYQIKNNDVIIVNPTFSKIKSAGFIGSPGSIASMASLVLSITLLIINK